jgi:hypothetical protein
MQHTLSIHQHILFKIDLYIISVLAFFVLCTLCCQFLRIVLFWLHLQYSPTFIYFHHYRSYIILQIFSQLPHYQIILTMYIYYFLNKRKNSYAIFCVFLRNCRVIAMLSINSIQQCFFHTHCQQQIIKRF